jgi:hypothetical protein
MRKLIVSLALLAVVGCSQSTSPGTPDGTYAPFTIANAGPGWHVVRDTLEIRNSSGSLVGTVVTDSTGHASIGLPPGDYGVQGLKPFDVYTKHNVKIESGATTRDTVNFCPFCV